MSKNSERERDTNRTESRVCLLRHAEGCQFRARRGCTCEPEVIVLGKGQHVTPPRSGSAFPRLFVEPDEKAEGA